MIITNGYATLIEFTARAGLDSTTVTAKTTLIEREIERNSRTIDQRTNTFFHSKTLTDSKVRFDFNANSDGIMMSEDATYIALPAPILTITEVLNNDVAMVEGEDYYIEGNLLIADTIFTTNRKNGVVITGTCGYAATPDDINEVCLAMTEVTTGLGIRTVAGDDGSKLSITRDEIPEWVYDRLDLRVRYDNVG